MASIKEEITIKEESILSEDSVNDSTFKIENEMTMKYVKTECIKDIEANEIFFCDEARGSDLSISKTERKHVSQSHADPHFGGLSACNPYEEKIEINCGNKNNVSMHTGDLFKCKFCHYKTASNDDLVEHERNRTGCFFKCKFCDYKATRNYKLVVHK